MAALQSPTNPHFFQPLLPGFDSHLNIPVAFFSKYLQGRNEENKTATLRTNASDEKWEVEIDGRRLTGGWKEFVTSHSLRIGDVLVFRHEGDLVFHVTALGPSCCEIEYTSAPHNIDDDRTDNKTVEKKRVKKKNPRTKEDSSTDHFVANVTFSSLRHDKAYIPYSFVRSNGLSKRHCKIVLLNEVGKSWNLTLAHDKIGANTYMRQGWRSFCSDNGIKSGRCCFKLVRKSPTPVIRLDQVYSHSCFVRSLTPSSLRNDSLYLPREFVKANGLKKGCYEIVLMNESGETWSLVSKHYATNNTTVVSGGWRNFCNANGIKARDTFRFKQVGTGEKPVLRLCPEESKLNTMQVDCSDGNDVTSLSTNSSSGEEESSESDESEEESRDYISVSEESEEVEKISSRECSNAEKSKKRGASSSSSQNRFVTLTVTPYSFKNNRLRLPTPFTKANGITKGGKITLMGKDGVKWKVLIAKDNRHGQMRLGRDWKGFCEAHRVKVGESFVLELIRGKNASPVLKFCNKVSGV